jgi:hypothetical protein
MRRIKPLSSAPLKIINCFMKTATANLLACQKYLKL